MLKGEDMINFLSTWVKNLALALIVVSILEMILPNNKTKKYVKMVMGLYILFSIISPFIENSSKFNIEDISFSKYIEEVSSTDVEVDQTSMDNRLNDIYKEQLEEDIIQKIENKGYIVEKCKVTAHISEEDAGIESIILKIKTKDEQDNKKASVENKIVQEIRKIQVSISKDDNNKNSDIEENTNITKTDINTIKEFLVNEYGVKEECLKIS